MDNLYRSGTNSERIVEILSNDNPYAESIFRTCKYRPEYLATGFESRQ